MPVEISLNSFYARVYCEIKTVTYESPPIRYLRREYSPKGRMGDNGRGFQYNRRFGGGSYDMYRDMSPIPRVRANYDTGYIPGGFNSGYRKRETSKRRSPPPRGGRFNNAREDGGLGGDYNNNSRGKYRDGVSEENPGTLGNETGVRRSVRNAREPDRWKY